MLTIANLRDHLYITLALVGGDEWGGVRNYLMRFENFLARSSYVLNVLKLPIRKMLTHLEGQGGR